MKTAIKIPHLGESVADVLLVAWLKGNGDYIKKGETLCEIESDKASVEIPAENSGILEITTIEGTKIKTGTVIGKIQ